MAEEKCTIAVITFNVKDKLRACILSVRRYLPHISITVWDNGSSDGTSEMIRDEFKYVNYHYSEDNLYFSRGCNELIKLCRSRYALLMNADITILDDSVLQVVDYMDNRNDLIAVSPSVRDHGLLRHMSSGIITPVVCIIRDSVWGRVYHDSAFYRSVMGDNCRPDEIFDIEKITNCCCMIRCKEFLEIGGYSQRQILYWTEEEFAMRIKKRGMKQAVYGKSVVEHEHGSSTQKLPASLIRAIYVHDRIRYMLSQYGLLYALLVEILLVRPKIWKTIMEYLWLFRYRRKIEEIKLRIGNKQLDRE